MGKWPISAERWKSRRPLGEGGRSRLPRARPAPSGGGRADAGSGTAAWRGQAGRCHGACVCLSAKVEKLGGIYLGLRFLFFPGKTPRLRLGSPRRNAEVRNEDPSLFLWENDRPFIQVMRGGLHEVSCGVYGRAATLQILVDGLPVLAATGGQDRPAGPVGLTIVDFLQLPPGAKVGLHYQPTDPAAGETTDPPEGFLALRRM